MNHPLEVGGEDSVLDKPAGELGPLVGVAAVDGQTRLGILVLGILQVAGYFLVYKKVKSGSDYMKLLHVSAGYGSFQTYFSRTVFL